MALAEHLRPQITVLMAVYNGMPYLPEAVESILSQTYEHWKLVLVDDGSTDESPGYLAGLEDLRIQVIRQDNRGLGAALNHGLAFCDTEFVARMDGDDIAHPTRLEEQIRYLRSNPDVGLVGTQIQRLGGSRRGTASVMATDHETIIADIRKGDNQMYHPTIMCRTELMKEIGGYWTHRRGEEWDLFLRMGERTRLANLDRVLLTYRIHEQSMTGSDVERMRCAIEYACHCARRRGDKQPPISYDEFIALRRTATWWRRTARALEMQARCQYQRSVIDLLSDRPARGYVRLAGAALFSPYLTRRRIVSVLRKRARGALRQTGLSNTGQAPPPPHHALTNPRKSSSQKLKIES